MKSTLLLTKRNLQLYFRDRANVFFSLLGALVLIGLYALFLGRLQVQTLQEQLPDADTRDIQGFVNAWVFAGITMITTLTTGLAALAVFVEDRTSGRFSDFMVSPLRRWQLVLGYLGSTLVVSVVMTVVIVVVGQIFLLSQGNPVISAANLGKLLGYVVLSSAAFAALSAFAVSFLRSVGAFSALSTVVGTLTGFLAGAYIPMGALPAGVVSFLNALPFAQSAMLIRRPFTASALTEIAGGQPEAVARISEIYGLTGSVGSTEVTTGLAVGTLLAMVVVFSLLSAWQLNRRIR